MRDTWPLLEQIPFPAIARGGLDTLQVNVGYRCNQTCVHCHVNAGPQRTEEMSRETLADVFAFIGISSIRVLDITGAAPELNAHFRELVVRARELGAPVIDRCNLTILGEPGQADLAQFLASRHAQVISSLPCYTEELVDRQRGKAVYDKSIS